MQSKNIMSLLLLLFPKLIGRLLILISFFFSFFLFFSFFFFFFFFFFSFFFFLFSFFLFTLFFSFFLSFFSSFFFSFLFLLFKLLFSRISQQLVRHNVYTDQIGGQVTTVQVIFFLLFSFIWMIFFLSFIVDPFYCVFLFKKKNMEKK